MDIRRGSYIIGEGGIKYVVGHRAVGAASLEITVQMAWGQNSEGRRITQGSLLLSLPDRREIVELPLRGEFVQTRVGGMNDLLTFKGSISFQTLEELEVFRAGRDLDLNTRFSFNTDDGRSYADRLGLVVNKGDRLIEHWGGDSNVKIPAADWLKVLEAVGYRRSLLLEVLYPYGQDQEDPLAKRLKKARDAFDGGRYEDCVAEVRHVLKEMDIRRDDKEQVAAAIGKYRDRDSTVRESMSLDERLLSLRRALDHVAHVAHHGGDDGITRSSAKATLVIAAALLELFPEP